MRGDWAIDVKMRQEIAADVATISRLETVTVALKVLRRVTGLRIAVVARVTDNSWTACAVRPRHCSSTTPAPTRASARIPLPGCMASRVTSPP